GSSVAAGATIATIAAIAAVGRLRRSAGNCHGERHQAAERECPKESLHRSRTLPPDAPGPALISGGRVARRKTRPSAGAHHKPLATRLSSLTTARLAARLQIC